MIRDEINGWLADLFHRDNITRTVKALAASQDQPGVSSSREATKKRVTDAETRLRRFQEAIEAGVDPAALAETINEVQAERAAATAELDATPTSSALSEAEIHARIDSLGEIGPALANTSPDKLANLYTAVSLQIRYQPDDHAADVTIEPVGRVNSKGVGGGT
ncbi:DUF3131 domain-containing protein [Actinopolyspora mortivallis]|uniref:DUF3131 domain-containing protein n=1 Tax=Actinopolyspora mortivallis TaxID=33906 RepID=UPI001C63A159|nr:DUF3131 domain-containing protein [Actinopolyspora mortivallis]